MGYKYYDTPMGQDSLKKLWITTKLAGTGGLAWSTIDVMLNSKPKGYLPTIGRYIYITGPFIGIAGAFSITANAAANFRGKDDTWNYVLGGIASGCITGAWRRSVMVGFVWSVVFAVAGIVKKSSIDEGWEILTFPKNRVYTTVFPRQFDFTLTKERPRNWTVGEPEKKEC